MDTRPKIKIEASAVRRRTTFVTQPPAEQTACRKCGAALEFTDKTICAACMPDEIYPPAPDDDIFATPRQPRIELPIRHAITCAVCGLTSKLPIGAPGDICGPCRVDLLQTRQHVETTLETARSRLHVVISNFEAAVARESEKDHARWEAVIAAQVKVQAGIINGASFRARWAEALAAGDGLSRILAAHEAHERGCQEVERAERWAARAMEELSLC
jgi:hypothetical protein